MLGMNVMRIAAASLLAVAAPYLLGFPLHHHMGVMIILNMVVSPALLGWYARRHCGLGRGAVLGLAAAVPIVWLLAAAVLTKGRKPLPSAGMMILPWIAFAALGSWWGRPPLAGQDAQKSRTSS